MCDGKMKNKNDYRKSARKERKSINELRKELIQYVEPTGWN